MSKDREPSLPRAVLERWSIVRKVWDHIAAELHLQVGERLPIEKTLAKEIGVGRPRLREALAILELLGLVERRRKRGTLLRKADPGYIVPYLIFYFGLDEHSDHRGTKTLRTLRNARAVIEGAVAAEAAQRRLGRDVIKMSALIESQEAAKGKLQEWLAFDCSFHAAVFAATRNPLLADLGKITIQSFASMQYPERVCRDPLARIITQEHWQLLEHIDKREPEKARRLMYTHIRYPKEARRNSSH